MKHLLMLCLSLFLISCGSQIPEKYTYQLRNPYSEVKSKIAHFNLSSEKDLGWTNNRIRFHQNEIRPGRNFRFLRTSWAPDLGTFSTFEGEISKRGSGSQLILIESPYGHNKDYSDRHPLLQSDGPDFEMSEYDKWVVRNLSVSRRSMVDYKGISSSSR